MNTRKQRSSVRKIIRYLLWGFLAFIVGFLIYFFFGTGLQAPEIADKSALEIQVSEPDSGLFAAGNARFRQSQSGLWELYIEGDAFERGVIKGKLTKALVNKQEEAFTDEIKKIIPSEGYLKFLKYFIAWFNRNIQDEIPEEYLHEIYGVSFAASEEFSYIGSNYERLLNYHGAHDIGHALSDLAMVGCTSFSLSGKQSNDGNLLLGRNFDFYVGERFAEDKIVAFYDPSSGHRFVMIIWGGFTGVVSGMNDKGLTLTMNAAKSDIPMRAAEPVSLIAREILQYAENIEQALNIAKKRQAFVSEALMIGSVQDKRTAIIEITPAGAALFDPKDNRIIGPNHFQSDRYRNTKANLVNLKKSSSKYRYERMHELLNLHPKADYKDAAEILRNPYGKDNSKIGLGNEKAINQLIAHHSVIFKPDELKIWVSTHPFQLGSYICYDLDSVFARFPGMQINQEICETEFEISPDSFLTDGRYKRFTEYKKMRDTMQNILKAPDKEAYNSDFPEIICSLNPYYFYAYELSADYYTAYGKTEKAKEFYGKALQKEISTNNERERIKEKLSELTDK